MSDSPISNTSPPPPPLEKPKKLAATEKPRACAETLTFESYGAILRVRCTDKSDCAGHMLHVCDAENSQVNPDIRGEMLPMTHAELDHALRITRVMRDAYVLPWVRLMIWTDRTQHIYPAAYVTSRLFSDAGDILTTLVGTIDFDFFLSDDKELIIDRLFALQKMFECVPIQYMYPVLLAFQRWTKSDDEHQKNNRAAKWITELNDRAGEEKEEEGEAPEQKKKSCRPSLCQALQSFCVHFDFHFAPPDTVCYEYIFTRLKHCPLWDSGFLSSSDNCITLETSCTWMAEGNHVLKHDSPYLSQMICLKNDSKDGFLIWDAILKSFKTGCLIATACNAKLVFQPGVAESLLFFFNEADGCGYNVGKDGWKTSTSEPESLASIYKHRFRFDDDNYDRPENGYEILEELLRGMDVTLPDGKGGCITLDHRVAVEAFQTERESGRTDPVGYRFLSGVFNASKCTNAIEASAYCELMTGLTCTSLEEERRNPKERRLMSDDDWDYRRPYVLHRACDELQRLYGWAPVEVKGRGRKRASEDSEEDESGCGGGSRRG